MAQAKSSNNTPSSPVATKATKAAKKAVKAKAKAKATAPVKKADSYLDRTFRSASQAERCLNLWNDRWGSYATLDPKAKKVADSLKSALDEVRGLKDEILGLHKTKWQPPKLAGGQALPLQVNTQVWFVESQREGYQAIYGEGINNMFIDKIVGGRMVVRIGESKVLTRFFAPKSHLQTTAPVAA